MSTQTLRTPTLWTVWVERWHPNSINECRGKHWEVEARIKRKMTDLLIAYRVANGIPRATGKRRVSLRLTFPPGARRPDKGNLRKLFDDACKRAGLIKDDGPLWLEAPEPEYNELRSVVWGTEITIAELP